MVFLEGFFEFFEHGEVANVAPNMLNRGAEGGEGAGDVEVDFAVVGLHGDGGAGGEAGFSCDEAV